MTNTLRTKDYIKDKFKTGDKPTEDQFSDWLTSNIFEGGNTGSIAHAIQTNGAVATGVSGSFASGSGVLASGNYGSFAQGQNTSALGTWGSFAQGKV